MTATDPTTLALTGQLPFIFSLGAILALPLSFLLLRLYRRAVLKGLNDLGGAGLLTLLRHLCAASDGTRAPSMSNAAS